MEPKQPATIGIDVSKATLDTVLLFTDDSFTAKSFSNEPAGIKQLLTWVAKQGRQSCALCLEASGGLELCLSGYQAKHPIRLVIPSRIAN